MFWLDTSVISELRKTGSSKVNSQVEERATSIPATQTFISVIAIFEIERGVLRMERRDRQQGKILRTWLNDYVLTHYSDRIIPISTRIAQRCVSLHVPDPMPDHDALIAATALEHSLTVVTRNIGGFERTDAKLFNPWATDVE